MVEIDSSPTTGSCTKVVRAAETRLQAAGFTADDMQVVIPEGKPDDGNIVARIRAPGAKKKGVLLLAHIDVVDAKRADWERDPFKLIEEGGFFYGRGAADDKAMAAVFLDLMLRLKKERGFKPKRDLILALTCGEETSNRVNGVDYLLKNKRELIDAAFATQRGRRRPALIRRAETSRAAGAGRRKDPPGVHARSDQQGWTFLAARARQRHLSPGARNPEGRGAGVSARAHARRARVFPRHGPDARWRDRRRDVRGREKSRRPGGAGDAHERPELQRRSFAPPASPPSSTRATHRTRCRNARPRHCRAA